MDPKKLVTQEKVIIPTNVVNKDAYFELIEADRRLQAHPERYYKSEETGVVFDFYQGHIKTHQLIEAHDFTEAEANLIRDKSRAFVTMKSSLNKYRFKAFKGEKKGTGILDRFQQEIIGLFGRFYTINEVHKVLTTEWGFKINLNTVNAFHARHAEAIQAEQDRYVRDWSGLKLVHKKSRLDEYSQLYENRKIRYEETNSREDYRLLLQTLESIRKEVEGDRLTVDGGIEINVQQNIQMHISQQIFRELNILEFIVARVSTRLNINPMIMMSRLEESYYAKFTGFKRPDNNMNTDEIYYPSRELYDFTKIKVENDRLKVERKQQKEAIQEVKVIEETDNVKENLMNALIRKKREIIEKEKILNAVRTKKVVKKKK